MEGKAWQVDLFIVFVVVKVIVRRLNHDVEIERWVKVAQCSRLM